MKRLRFLIIAEYAGWIETIVAYLINAGHIVNVVDNNTPEFWQKKYSHDLTLITLSEISPSDYDYCIAAHADSLLLNNIPHLTFSCLIDEEQRLSIAIYLLINNQQTFLIKDYFTLDFYHLEDFYLQLQELFIDAILILSRHEPLLSPSKPLKDNQWSSLIVLEKRITALKKHYYSLDTNKKNIFNITNLYSQQLVFRCGASEAGEGVYTEYMTEADGARNKTENSSAKSISLHHQNKTYQTYSHFNPVILSPNHIELLSLSLIILLNGRKSSTYKYDYQKTYQAVTKYIEFNILQDNANTLLEKIKNPNYLLPLPILSNHFINKTCPSEIAIFIDTEVKENTDYAIEFFYFSEKGHLKIRYLSSLFFFENITPYIEHIYKGLEQFSLSTLLCSESSLYSKMLYDWNDTQKQYPKDKTIHQLFEEQALKTPNNIAIIDQNASLTYREFNEKTNQFAHYLLHHFTIKPDDKIALFLKRDISLFIALFAVLKTGAAYVPLDSQYPEERILTILNDSQAKLILINQDSQQHLSQRLCIPLLAIDHLPLSSFSNDNPITSVSSKNLAYLLYTSGTTGKPKGVLIEHSGVVNLAIQQEELFEKARESDEKPCRYLFYASCAFDGHVSELFTALTRGHILHIIDDITKKDLFALQHYIISQKINVATIPPALLNHETILPVELLISAGNLIDSIVLEAYLKHNIQVINAYGPSEITVCATMHHFQPGDLNTNIGKPIANKTVYVLDKQMTPVPIGVEGELYVGGEGIARAYQNLAEKTAEHFIANPFQTQEEKRTQNNARLYKTGDYVKWLSDGNLDYVGRQDEQINLRGHRIERREIEEAMLRIPGIQQAIVLLRTHKNDNNKYLAGYYVTGQPLLVDTIHEYLSKQLPDYMIPQRFIPIEALPIKTTGKVDIAALEAIKIIEDHIDAYAPPTNSQEKLICDMFAEVLNIKSVSIHDDFFKLGGDSIRAIRLTSKLQINFDIKVSDILNLRTPIALAKNTTYGKNTLKNKLRRIKQLYQKKNGNQDFHSANSLEISKKIQKYRQHIHDIVFDSTQLKDLSTILLTGSTGYLGCHLLYELLLTTSYNIFALVRETTDDNAYKRLKEKFHYYFHQNLDKYADRVTIYASDLTEPNFNLTKEKYEKIKTEVDSIIHAAASVKHYGTYEEFYQSNVEATTRLLALCQLTRLKDFHYISTTAPLAEFKSSQLFHCFTEDDHADSIKQLQNVYYQTKYLSEHVCEQHRQSGLSVNIYRVGNLAFAAKGSYSQEKIEDNAFYRWLDSLFKLECITSEISLINITPVDLTARAIIKLFNKTQLNNNVFHVFNPYLFNLTTVLKTVSIQEFIDRVIEFVDDNRYGTIEWFLLRQGWLDNVEHIKSEAQVLQERTAYFLKKMDFEWTPISNKVFDAYIEKAKCKKTKKRSVKTKKVFEDFARITQFLPIPIYWLDINATLLGGNEHFFQTLGISTDYIGTNGYDVYPKEIADHIVMHDKQVMSTGIASSQEELTKDIITGKPRYFSAYKTPLRNKSGKVIGLVGNLIDITNQREAEKLQLENTEQKVKIEEQEKFYKVANQLSHDMRSPLSTLKMLSEQIADKLTNNERVICRNALTRAIDILNSGFVHYKPSNEVQEEKQFFMVSTALEQVLSEKRLEYQKQSITFEMDFAPSAMFVFFQVKLSAFNRMISNLINNAVDAIENKLGKIIIRLTTDGEDISIVIEDNGKGMPLSVKENIVNNIAITSGKPHGNGIGFTQIRDTLQMHNGKLFIDSTVGIGTKIKLLFPESIAPEWATNCIILNPSDIIIVIDDDLTMHAAWEIRFNAEGLQQAIYYFAQGNEAIQYLKKLSSNEKKSVVLLTDYELLGQPINGLDIIEQTQIIRAILVTSHSDNDAVRKRALSLGVKILPKFLISCISIFTSNEMQPKPTLEKIVFIDDDRLFLESIRMLIFQKQKVDTYTHPQDFLDNLSNYSKDTHLFIDNNLGHNIIKGITLAKQLHEQGYLHLYLLSGDTFANEVLPPYLTVIQKTDTERLVNFKKNVPSETKNTDNTTLFSPSITVTPSDISLTDNISNINSHLRRLSHDARNSLAIIQLNADLMKFSTQNKETMQQIQNIQQAQKECTHRLSMQLAELRMLFDLPFSSEESSHSLGETVESALKEYPFRKEERARIRYAEAEQDYEYWGNIDMLKQLLFHLLKESLYQLDENEKSKITITFAQKKQDVQLQIRYPYDNDKLSNEISLDIKFCYITASKLKATLKNKIESTYIKWILQLPIPNPGENPNTE
jgi:surfactin family lipopeptide synthetase A